MFDCSRWRTEAEPLRQAFHFESLPAEEASDALQALAAWALRRSLSLDDATPPPSDAIETWCSLTGFQGRRRWMERRPRLPAIRRRTKAKRWSLKQFQQALSAPQADMPDFFFALVASRAWTDPAFELEVWEGVRTWLCREMVFSDALEQGLGFSPLTFWSMIAAGLQQEGAQKGLRNLWRLRKVRRVARAFERIAFQRGRYIKEWAGFWDQWLLSYALEGFEEEDMSEWMLRLRDMPFLRHRRGVTPYPSALKTGLRPYRRNWSLEAPPLLLKAYGYETSPPPLPVGSESSA